MSAAASAEPRTHYSTTLPLSFYGLHGGSGSAADTSSSASESTPSRSFLDFLTHVQIESDPDEGGTGGAIPFDIYDYQRERAERWVTGASEVILKPRQIGFSWLAAAYAYWTAGYHESAHVALFSAGEDEVKALVRKVSYIHDHLPENIRATGSVGIQAASFTLGSTITGHPATQKAGIGSTLKLAIFDEAAFHRYLRENQGAVVPALGGFGQLLILSTADPTLGTYGYYHDFYWASKEGRTNCEAVFLPADVRPGRDAAWFERERLKYPNDPDKFAAFYPFTDLEAFVGRTGLVYGRDERDGVLIFDEARNMRPAPAPWAECKWRLGGVDPGGSDPTAMLAVGVSKDERVHVYSLLRRHGPVGTQEMAEWFWEIEQRGAGKLNWGVVDPSAVSVAPSLDQLWGRKAWYPANNDKRARIGLVATWLKSGRLTFSPHLKELKQELESYWIVERKEGSLGGSAIVTRTPSSHHADLLDVLGYICLAIVAGLPSGISLGGRQTWGSATVDRTQNRRRGAEQQWAK